MHLKRQAVTMKLPIPRKGTTYIARASSNINDSVSVLSAVRDILKLARTLREVKYLIHSKLLKLNGRYVRDYRESIKLFNILEADKTYMLTILPTGRFSLEEVKDKEKRPCKVINKKILNGNKLQINLHDGTNLSSKDKIEIGDTVYINKEGKIVSHVKLEKGKNAFITNGKYKGLKGKIESIEDNKVSISLSGKSVLLTKSQIILI